MAVARYRMICLVLLTETEDQQPIVSLDKSESTPTHELAIAIELDTEFEVSIEHLKQGHYANKRHLFLRTPGSVNFGLAYVLSIPTSLL